MKFDKWKLGSIPDTDEPIALVVVCRLSQIDYTLLNSWMRVGRIVRTEKPNELYAYKNWTTGASVIRAARIAMEFYGPTVQERINQRRQKLKTLKKAFYRVVADAKKRGLIEKQPCEVCGQTKSESHHDDEKKPLEVRWLCKKHHVAWHKSNKVKNGIIEEVGPPPRMPMIEVRKVDC